MSHKANDQITDNVEAWWNDPKEKEIENHRELLAELKQIMKDQGLDDSVWTDFFRSQTRRLK